MLVMVIQGGKVCKTIDSNNDNIIDAPSSPPKVVDHQEVNMTPPDNPVHLSALLPLHWSTHSNKGILPMQPDEDPRLEQGSRPHARGTQTLVAKPQTIIPVGMNDGIKPSINVICDDIGLLYLTVDTPQTYREAMRCSDADGWVEAIAVEYENLHCKGVFKEVEAP